MTGLVHFRMPALLLLLLAMVGATQVCEAHAILMDSTPKLNSTLKGSELDINLRFNVRVDGERSRLRLVGPDGSNSTLTFSQSKPDILQTHAGGLKPGAYKLEWQVLASDGHISRGEIPFRIT
jgi:hypothetical protein